MSKTEQLTTVIRTYFNRLKSYGLSPEEKASRNSHMVMELISFPIETVEKAFAEYARENAEIPVLADIRKYISRVTPSNRKNDRFETKNDYNKLTDHERKNLHDYLTRAKQEIAAGKSNLASPDIAKPWIYKTWGEYTDHDKSSLQAHMESFDDAERAAGYAKYLKNHCGVPLEFTRGAA